MQKITVRRIVLGSILLCISLLALFTLFFNVIYADFGAITTDDTATTATKVFADNGFALIGRNSVFLTELKAVRMKGADALIAVCQSLSILFLVMAIAAIALTILGFFFDKTEKIFLAAIILSALVFVGYMVIGIVVRSVFIDTCLKNTIVYEEIFGTAISSSDKVVIEKALKAMIKTAAFVPLIIGSVFVVGYIVVARLLKNDNVTIDRAQRTESVATGAAYTVCVPCDFRKIDVSYLRELKQLLDDGILTDDEFAEQKRLVLGKHE